MNDSAAYTGGGSASDRDVTVRDRGVRIAFGKWLAWCACGFLETGWPNYDIAKASLRNHVERCPHERRSA